jgi:hypothetical protein
MTQLLKKEKIQNSLKKLGFWGFLFFLGKGIIWLILAYVVFK